MKKYIKKHLGGYLSVFSEDSMIKYAVLMKDVYRSFGLSSSSVKVKIILALIALSVSILIAILRNLIS